MATLTPVRMPGSSPMVVFEPAGAASNKSFKLLAKTLIASASAASRSLNFRSNSIRVNSFIFQAKRAVSANQALAGRVVSVTLRCLATNWAQSRCSSLSSTAGFRVMDNKSSLRPLRSAKARCEGILLMAS